MLNNVLNTTKKKVVAITATGLIVLGATSTFGQVSFQYLTDFAQSIFNTEKGKMTTQAETERTADLSAFEQAITALKNRITTEITAENDVQKKRVTDEVNTYQTNLETQATEQVDTDIAAKKAELQSTADAEIQSSKDALDAKYNEIMGVTPAQ